LSLSGLKGLTPRVEFFKGSLSPQVHAQVDEKHFEILGPTFSNIVREFRRLLYRIGCKCKRLLTDFEFFFIYSMESDSGCRKQASLCRNTSLRKRPTGLYYARAPADIVPLSHNILLYLSYETTTNIPRYCTVSYCSVTCVRSSCYTCSFLSSYLKRLKKVKLHNKSLIRCFGVKYRHIYLLVVCILTRPAGSSKYSTARKNIWQYFTPKHLITHIYH